MGRSTLSLNPKPTWWFRGSYKGVISKVTIIITHIRGLITALITTLHPIDLLKEPPLKPYNSTYDYP